MKSKRTVAMIASVTAVILAGAVYTATLANGFSIQEDFENLTQSTWTDLYKTRAVQSIQQEEGNNYLQIDYTTEEGTPAYYDVVPASAQPTGGIVQADFDINFPETGTARNGQIQIKSRTGQGASQTQIAARLVKNYYYLEYGEAGTLKTLEKPTGGYFKIVGNTWYKVKMIVNLEEHWQSIYIFDRTGEQLLALLEHAALNVEMDQINMVTFSGSTTLKLDNVDIGNVTTESGFIYGAPYARRPKTGTSEYSYHLLGQAYNGKITAPAEIPQWSLETPAEGIDIDAATGKLTVEPLAPLKKMVIKAAAGGQEYRYAVDIKD